MIKASLSDMMKEFRLERPDNATLFEEMLFYVKDSKREREVTILRFDNGFGAVVFLDSPESADVVYAVHWPDTARGLQDYNVTHEPFGGPTNQGFTTFDEMRTLLRKIRSHPPF